MAIITLDDAAGCSSPDPFAGPDHPIRQITREIAFEGRWDRSVRRRIIETFDRLAPQWSEDHVHPTKAAPVHDAIARGGVPTAGARWLEFGSGTGAGGMVLADRVDEFVAIDLSAEMIRNDPAAGIRRIRGDASAAPFRAESFDSLLCINMFLFPAEVDRLLRPDGHLVWVNTLGDQTPIHLSVADVVRALPGEWAATTARAGTGFWATVRRR